MLTRNNSRPAIPSPPLSAWPLFHPAYPFLSPFRPRRRSMRIYRSLSSPVVSRSRGVSTRILVNTVGFSSFHVGVRMLLEDITTGLACLTRFDATSLSVSLARSPACPGLSCNNAHSRDFRLHLLLEFCARNCHSRRD